MLNLNIVSCKLSIVKCANESLRFQVEVQQLKSEQQISKIEEGYKRYYKTHKAIGEKRNQSGTWV